MSNGSPWNLNLSTTTTSNSHSEQPFINASQHSSSSTTASEILSPVHKATKSYFHSQKSLPPQAPWDQVATSTNDGVIESSLTSSATTYPTILDGSSGSYVSLENPKKYLSDAPTTSSNGTTINSINGNNGLLSSPKRNSSLGHKRASNLSSGISFSTPSLPQFTMTSSSQQLPIASQMTSTPGNNPSNSNIGANLSNNNNNNGNNGNLYKTELCRSYMETGKCRYGSKCMFAHGNDELRSVQRHPRYRTEICKSYHILGKCRYGTRCKFIHLKPGESLPPGCTLVDDTPPVSHRSSSMAALVDDSTPVNQLIPEKMFDLVLGDNPLTDNTSLSSSASCSASFSELPPFNQPSSSITSSLSLNNNNNNIITNNLNSNNINESNNPYNNNVNNNAFNLSDTNSPILSPLNSQQQKRPGISSPLSLSLKLQQQQQQQQQPSMTSPSNSSFQQLNGQRLHLPSMTSLSLSQPNSGISSPQLLSASSSPPLTSHDGVTLTGMNALSGGNPAVAPASGLAYQPRQQSSQNLRPLRIVRSNSGIIGGRTNLSRMSSVNYGGFMTSSSSSSNLAMVASAASAAGNGGNGLQQQQQQQKSASYSKLPGYN